MTMHCRLRQICLPLALTFALCACATSPEKVASDAQASSAGLTLSDAAKSISQPLSLDKPFPWKLNNKSLLLKVEKENSPYQTHLLELPKASAVEIAVRSYCDCFGFNKYIMRPKAYLAVHGNSPTILAPVGSSSKEPGAFSAASIVTYWKTPVMPAGRHTILIAADMTEAGKVVHRYDQSNQPPGMKLIVEMAGADKWVSHPYGKYDISAKEMPP